MASSARARSSELLPGAVVGPVRLRPIEPGDVAALAAFYASLSAESRRFRFLSVATTLGHEAVREFCGPDHEHREGFVAVTEAGPGEERIVAHLCLEPVADDDMEIGVAVADDYQGHGIGTHLVEAASAWAAAHGIHRFHAWFAADNAGIRRLLAHLDRPFSRERWSSGAIEIAIDLSASASAAPAPDPRPRAA